MSSSDKVKNIIIDKLGVDESRVIAEASFLDDLGADSLDTVELIMEFEEEFDLDIPDADAEKITTVGAAFEYVNKHFPLKYMIQENYHPKIFGIILLTVNLVSN